MLGSSCSHGTRLRGRKKPWAHAGLLSLPLKNSWPPPLADRFEAIAPMCANNGAPAKRNMWRGFPRGFPQLASGTRAPMASFLPTGGLVPSAGGPGLQIPIQTVHQRFHLKKVRGKKKENCLIGKKEGKKESKEKQNPKLQKKESQELKKVGFKKPEPSKPPPGSHSQAASATRGQPPGTRSGPARQHKVGPTGRPFAEIRPGRKT